MAQTRSASTLPARTSSFTAGIANHVNVWKNPQPRIKEMATATGKIQTMESNTKFLNAPIYLRMQNVVQRMLHSEHGVPIKSHKRRLISAIPSAFTGADMVNWLTRNLSTGSKAEAIHLANLLCRHGYFFCVEGVSAPVKDDGTLYRFQSSYYWPSKNPDVSDFEYGVYLVKQVLRSKHRIRLLDYELKNLHKLKLRLAKDWKAITDKADDDVRVFREQKRVAKAILSSQEEAFWRLHRPPPGENSVQDSALTRHSTERQDNSRQMWTEETLKKELVFLKSSAKQTRWKVSTAVEQILTFNKKYKDFDPMLTTPLPSNPWITGDDTMWTVEKSLIEYPTERHVRKWACSFQDLLNDVTGRFRFEEYCKSQFNLENVRFWQACRDLKSLPLTAVNGSVQLVYDEFLQRGAHSEVNVSADVQVEVEKDLKQPSRYAFAAAQEQIYKLMQNDIYPRFLKSIEYQTMLRKGKEIDEAGKGFFGNLKKKKFENVRQDATGISPCLPARYTKRQLSITRKIPLTSLGGSSSLDDIFLACGTSPVRKNPFVVETKRNSAYTEAFIDALTSPNPEKVLPNEIRSRRISAPESTTELVISSPKSNISQLENISEDEMIKPSIAYTSTMDIGVPMSYSADDLQQLMEESDSIGPSKWKKFGIAAGIDFTDLHTGGEETYSGDDDRIPFLSPRRSHSHNANPVSEVMCMPILNLTTSPQSTSGTFEYESLKKPGTGTQFLKASSESIHSTTSH